MNGSALLADGVPPGCHLVSDSGCGFPAPGADIFDFADALDVIAERIRALGHPAPGTYESFSKLASFKEVDGVPRAMDMVRHLVAAQEATARTARKLLPVADAANDQPTLDLLTQRLDVHEKTAWMLRSLLEE